MLSPKVFETSFHPLLPTVEEVKVGQSFYSDHLPLMTEEKMDGGALKAITWNLHAPGRSTSGFGADEDDDKIIKRGMKSITALLSMIDKNKPDVVLLQETYFFDELLEKRKGTILRDFLTKELSQRNFSFSESGEKGDPKDLLMLYSDRLTPLTKPKATQDELAELQSLPHSLRQDLKYGTQTQMFQHKDTQKNVTVTNVHWPHDDLPFRAEELLKFLLKTPNHFVGGDFNNRIVVPGKSYLINNVVPPMFRNGEQGADYTDGFLFSSEKNKIHQSARVELLNPGTGNVYSVETPELKSLTPAKQKELLKQHLFISFADEKVAALGEGWIYLRPTSNAFNQRGLALAFPNYDQDAFIQFLQNHLPDKLTVSEAIDNKKYAVCFAEDQAKHVLNFVHIYFNNRNVFKKASVQLQILSSTLADEIKVLQDNAHRTANDDVNLKRKTEKKNAIDLIKCKTDDWVIKGVAVESKPFATNIEHLKVAAAEITAGGSISLFGKTLQFRVPRTTRLLDELVKLDGELIAVGERMESKAGVRPKS